MRIQKTPAALGFLLLLGCRGSYQSTVSDNLMQSVQRADLHEIMPFDSVYGNTLLERDFLPLLRDLTVDLDVTVFLDRGARTANVSYRGS